MFAPQPESGHGLPIGILDGRCASVTRIDDGFGLFTRIDSLCIQFNAQIRTVAVFLVFTFRSCLSAFLVITNSRVLGLHQFLVLMVVVINNSARE